LLDDITEDEAAQQIPEARTPDDDSDDDDDLTPLHHAVRDMDVNLVRYLLEQNNDINAQDIDHLTPFHYAILDNNLEIVELFLQYGADPNQLLPMSFPTRSEHSILYYAQYRGYLEVANLLVKYGAHSPKLISASTLNANILQSIQILSAQAMVISLLKNKTKYFFYNNTSLTILKNTAPFISAGIIYTIPKQAIPIVYITSINVLQNDTPTFIDFLMLLAFNFISISIGTFVNNWLPYKYSFTFATIIPVILPKLISHSEVSIMDMLTNIFIDNSDPASISSLSFTAAITIGGVSLLPALCIAGFTGITVDYAYAAYADETLLTLPSFLSGKDNSGINS
jgi:hypothetical protein